MTSLKWCHNEHDGISNHRRLDYLLNHLFRLRWKKTSELHVTGLCEGNSLVTGEFPTQRASDVENDSSLWRRHDTIWLLPQYASNGWVLRLWSDPLPVNVGSYFFTFASPSWHHHHVTLMSHEYHDVSNQRQSNCLFSSLFRLTPKEISRFHITGSLWGESTGYWWILSCYDIMLLICGSGLPFSTTIHVEGYMGLLLKSDVVLVVQIGVPVTFYCKSNIWNQYVLIWYSLF